MAITKPTKGSGGKTPASKAGPQVPASANKKALAPPPDTSKKFVVGEWDSETEGEKIMLYGETGIGKTSLGLLAPNPVFIGIDTGGRKLRHPVTGKPIKVIGNKDNPIRTFSDVRAALQQVELYDDYETVEIDTVTVLEDWAVPHMLETIPTEKGTRATNILSYGWNKGYRHLYDLMKLILDDCETLIRRGKNVILIAQGIASNVPNVGGEDFLRHGPRLYNGKLYPVEGLYCEWVDHIFRVDYLNKFVTDKKVSGSTERAVFTEAELHFRAKSKPPITEPVISYENPGDDSLWKFLFPEKGGE